MNPLEPPDNPFGGDAFARLWDGWQGRRLNTIEARGFRMYYVSKRRGPSCTLDALPYGVPVLSSDADPGARACVEQFFRLSSIRSSLSLFARPKGVYPRVHWLEQMRSVVTLSDDWESRVDPDVRRRFARAEKDNWRVVPFEEQWWTDVGLALHDTDRRHDVDPRFDVAFFQKLVSLLGNSGRLHMPCAVRNDRLGAMNVVLAAGGYEVSWFLLATDEARREGVVPMLKLAWIEACAARGATVADLGASPSSSVQRFKASFGAQLVPYYSGTRRWSLFGAR